MHLEIRLYYEMLRIRRIEERIADSYGDQEMRCPVHLSIGQEALAVGVCAALRRDDKVVSTHRAHAHYLAKGGDLPALIAELYGKASGTCGGRGGSMHIFDKDAGLMLSVPIVGSSIPVGVGAALAMKQEGASCIAVSMFGDAALEEGIFHEAANFASLQKLPILFVCENNLFSVYTRLDDRQPRRPLADVAHAHGMPTVHGDGNDVSAVLATTREAAERARFGTGPSLLVFDTYRWLEHCGPGYDNHIGYRTEAEFLDWKTRCPVERHEKRLRVSELLDDGRLAAIEAKIEAEIEAAFAAARKAPLPAVASSKRGVYA